MGRTTTLAAMALVVLLTGGCKKDKPQPVKEDPEVGHASRGDALQRDGSRRRADAVCREVACTKMQSSQLQKLYDELKPMLRPPRRAPLDSAASAALARAFATETFDVAALQAYRAATEESGASDDDEREAAIAEAVTKTHALLDAEQRGRLGEVIRKDGLHLFSGRARLGPGRSRLPDPARRATRLAERMCEALECTLDQESRIITALTKLPSTHAEDPEEARQALGTAFDGEALEQTAVEAYFRAARSSSRGSDQQRDQVWLEVHAALTPEQRSELAADIEERGLAAIGGGRGRARTRGRRPDKEDD